MDAEQKFQMVLYLVKRGMAYVDAKSFVEDLGAGEHYSLWFDAALKGILSGDEQSA